MKELKRISAFFMAMLMMLTVFSAFSAVSAEGEAAGGNGRTFEWSLIKALEKPFFLAGGLTVDNVQQAVRMTSPYGIDASSCMETEDCKDLNKMKAFAQAVRVNETNN